MVFSTLLSIVRGARELTYALVAGVPRILDNTLPPHLETCDDDNDPDWRYYVDYLRTTRININVRQVFPKDFEPGL
jgi:alkylated DNA repair protein alkB homolog 1